MYSTETFRPCSQLYFFLIIFINIYSRLNFQTSKKKKRRKKNVFRIDWLIDFYFFIFEWGLVRFYWMGDVIILEKNTGNWVTVELCQVRLMGHEENRSCACHWVRNLVSEEKARGGKKDLQLTENWALTNLCIFCKITVIAKTHQELCLYSCQTDVYLGPF